MTVDDKALKVLADALSEMGMPMARVLRVCEAAKEDAFVMSGEEAMGVWTALSGALRSQSSDAWEIPSEPYRRLLSTMKRAHTEWFARQKERFNLGQNPRSA